MCNPGTLAQLNTLSTPCTAPQPTRCSTQVWQVRASYDAKPHRKTMMQLWCAGPLPTCRTHRWLGGRTAKWPVSRVVAVSEDHAWCGGGIQGTVFSSSG